MLLVDVPFAVTLSSLGSNQCFFPAAMRYSAVSCEMCTLLGCPVDSSREVVFMVSPNNWNLALSPRKTPAVTGPLCSYPWICYEI